MEGKDSPRRNLSPRGKPTEEVPTAAVVRLAPVHPGGVRGSVRCDLQNAQLLRGTQTLRVQRIFDEDAGTEELYDDCVGPLVGQVIEGKQAVVVVYGKSQTGRTYTMLGSPDNHGFIPRAINDVYARVAEPHPGVRYQVRISSIQIVADYVRDTINRENDVVSIRTDAHTDMVRLAGAEEIEASKEAAMELVDVTLENQEPAVRSTCIFRFAIERRELCDDGTTLRSEGVLHLVDLCCADPQAKGEPDSMVKGILGLKEQLKQGSAAAHPSEMLPECCYLHPWLTGGNCIGTVVLCCAGLPDEDTWQVAQGVRKIVNRVRPNVTRVEGTMNFEPEISEDEELPEGWEMRRTEDGRPYFIDLRDGERTTWNDPRRAPRRGDSDAGQSVPRHVPQRRHHMLRPGERNFYKEGPPPPTVRAPVAVAVTDSQQTTVVVHNDRWDSGPVAAGSKVPLVPSSPPVPERAAPPPQQTPEPSMLSHHRHGFGGGLAGFARSLASIATEENCINEDGDMLLAERHLDSFLARAQEAQREETASREDAAATQELAELQRLVAQRTVRRDQLASTRRSKEAQAAEAARQRIEAEAAAARTPEPASRGHSPAPQPLATPRDTLSALGPEGGTTQALAALLTQLREAPPLRDHPTTRGASAVGPSAAGDMHECHQLAGRLVAMVEERLRVKEELRDRLRRVHSEHESKLRAVEQAFTQQRAAEVRWLRTVERAALAGAPPRRSGAAAG